MSQQNPGRPAGATAFVLSLYFVIACIWAWPATARPDRRVHDLGDPLHLGYIMAWDAHQIVRQPWALFDANSFYPYSRSLTFADHLLPEALLVAPINWSTGNAVLAFNTAVILALTASAFCMYSLMLVVTRSRAAAMLAGLVYAFNGFMLQETPRVHVLNIQWWPLALLFLMKFVERASVRSGCLAIGLLFIQALSGSYYLIYTALFAPCWLIALYVFMRRAPDRRALAILAGAGVLAAALGILILHPYLATLKTLTIEKGWAGGADLLSFFDPGPRNWLYGGARPAIQAAEVPHFIGIAALILAIWGALVTIRASAERRALAVVALGTIVFSAAMTLGPLVHLGGRLLGGGPYDWLYWNVPLVRGMASPERIGILIKLGLAILVGFGAERLLSRLQTIQRTAMMILLILLLPLEHWSPARRIAGVDVPTGSLVPQVYRDLAQSGSTPVVDLPLYPERAKKLWALYLYFSTYHWRPIPIGRTSFYPPAHDFLAWSLGDFPSATSLRLLDQMGVRTVVVHPNIWPLCERNERLRQIEGTP
ncbi:MAG: hypothetical protein MUF51_10595, partial [Vicinamibacteria bacterium]|nr:hypothetical protein [Vicinamibacteria bacterium]